MDIVEKHSHRPHGEFTPKIDPDTATTSGTDTATDTELPLLTEVHCDGELTFADQSLERAVRDSIGTRSGALYYADVAVITELTVIDSSFLHDLSGVQCLDNLTKLDLQGNSIRDTSPLAVLSRLNILCLARNEIDDITALSHLRKISSLQLSQNDIVDITPIASMTGAEYIAFESNPVSCDDPATQSIIAGLRAAGVIVVSDCDGW